MTSIEAQAAGLPRAAKILAAKERSNMVWLYVGIVAALALTVLTAFLYRSYTA